MSVVCDSYGHAWEEIGRHSLGGGWLVRYVCMNGCGAVKEEMH